MYHGLGISPPSSSSLHGAESHWWLCPTAARRPWSLLACLLEAQDSSELCYKTIKIKLKSRAINLPNKQFRGLQQHERLSFQTEEEDCVGRLSGSSGSGCLSSSSSRSPRSAPLACLCSASDIYFDFFLANHRISGARFLLF